MEPAFSLSALFWLVVFFCVALTPVAVVGSFFKLRGIERALWAVVSQLQALRRESAPGNPRPVQEKTSESAPERHAMLSAFGR
jgi:hypothetical protein